LQFGINRVYAGVFFDFGNAWNEKFNFGNFRKDAGIELRIDGTSFYVFPMKLFFSFAYGFDKFERVINKERFNYGREFRFYFGLVFEFDSLE